MASDEKLSDLRASMRGDVLVAEDGPAFQQAAFSVWAVSPTHERLPEPALVVLPRGTSDVAAAIKWATKNGLPVAVKCGGHGGGNPTCIEGGLLIHLSHMRSVCVDPAARTALVDGGCLAADVDAETALYGLAAPLGVCPTVGVGGLALNGGLSLLSRAYGAACDNILEATMVLADGSVVCVTPETDPDLFWAVRGAGTALGVVTKLKLQLHDVSDAYCGALVWADDAEHDTYRAILRWIRGAVLPNPSIGFNVTRALDPQAGPVLVAMVVVVGEGSQEDKAALIQPLRELGPLQDTVGSSTWRQTQSTHGPAIAALTQAFPVHYEAWCGGHLMADKFSDAFIEEWVGTTCDALPLPDCAITLSFLELAGGKLREGTGPLGLKADVQWVSQVGWADPACHATGAAYAAKLRGVLAPYTCYTSGYINLVDVGEVSQMGYAQAAAAVGGADRLERLRAVKARVDPANLFTATPHRLTLAAALEKSSSKQ